MPIPSLSGPEQREAAIGGDRGTDLGHVAYRHRVRIELDDIIVGAQIEQGQQPLPCAALRAGAGIDVADRSDHRIGEVMREQAAIGIGQRAVVEDRDPADAEPRVQRLHRDQIGQQHARADHREEQHAIGGRHDRPRRQHRARGAQMQRLADFPQDAVDHRALPPFAIPTHPFVSRAIETARVPRPGSGRTGRK